MNKGLYTLSCLALLTLVNCDDQDPSPTPEAKKKLDYYTETFTVPGLEFDPQMKIQYEYGTDDVLTRHALFGFNPETESMEEQRHFVYAYTDSLLTTITGYLAGSDTHYLTYTYNYLPDGKVLTIVEENISGFGATASFWYSENEDSLRVTYTYSNGATYAYLYLFSETQNILSHTTKSGSDVCNEGTYTYDNRINPFKELGYVDYFLTNLSTNNTLTEDISYTNCYFPEAIPESYTYEYDEDGYPTLATVSYRGSSEYQMERRFYYIN